MTAIAPDTVQLDWSDTIVLNKGVIPPVGAIQGGFDITAYQIHARRRDLEVQKLDITCPLGKSLLDLDSGQFKLRLPGLPSSSVAPVTTSCIDWDDPSWKIEAAISEAYGFNWTFCAYQEGTCDLNALLRGVGVEVPLGFNQSLFTHALIRIIDPSKAQQTGFAGAPTDFAILLPIGGSVASSSNVTQGVRGGGQIGAFACSVSNFGTVHPNPSGEGELICQVLPVVVSVRQTSVFSAMTTFRSSAYELIYTGASTTTGNISLMTPLIGSDASDCSAFAPSSIGATVTTDTIRDGSALLNSAMSVVVDSITTSTALVSGLVAYSAYEFSIAVKSNSPASGTSMLSPPSLPLLTPRAQAPDILDGGAITTTGISSDHLNVTWASPRNYGSVVSSYKIFLQSYRNEIKSFTIQSPTDGSAILAGTYALKYTPNGGVEEISPSCVAWNADEATLKTFLETLSAFDSEDIVSVKMGPTNGVAVHTSIITFDQSAGDVGQFVVAYIMQSGDSCTTFTNAAGDNAAAFATEHAFAVQDVVAPGWTEDIDPYRVYTEAFLETELQSANHLEVRNLQEKGAYRIRVIASSTPFQGNAAETSMKRAASEPSPYFVTSSLTPPSVVDEVPVVTVTTATSATVKFTEPFSGGAGNIYFPALAATCSSSGDASSEASCTGVTGNAYTAATCTEPGGAASSITGATTSSDKCKDLTGNTFTAAVVQSCAVKTGGTNNDCAAADADEATCTGTAADVAANACEFTAASDASCTNGGDASKQDLCEGTDNGNSYVAAMCSNGGDATSQSSCEGAGATGNTYTPASIATCSNSGNASSEVACRGPSIAPTSGVAREGYTCMVIPGIQGPTPQQMYAGNQIIVGDGSSQSVGMSCTLVRTPPATGSALDTRATVEATVTGLRKGTSYQFAFRATNKAGDAPSFGQVSAVSASTSVTLLTLASGPTWITPKFVTNAQPTYATLHFTTPEDIGGTSILGYKLYVQTFSDGPVLASGTGVTAGVGAATRQYTEFVADTSLMLNAGADAITEGVGATADTNNPKNSTSVTVYGLSAGAVYNFKVAAINSVGVGNASPSSDPASSNVALSLMLFGANNASSGCGTGTALSALKSTIAKMLHENAIPGHNGSTANIMTSAVGVKEPPEEAYPPLVVASATASSNSDSATNAIDTVAADGSKTANLVPSSDTNNVQTKWSSTAGGRCAGQWVIFDLVGGHDVAGMDKSTAPATQFVAQEPPAISGLTVHFAVLDQNATAEFGLETSQDNVTWLTASDEFELKADMQSHAIANQVASSTTFGPTSMATTATAGWTVLSIASFTVKSGVATATHANTSSARMRVGDKVTISGASVTSFNGAQVKVVGTPTATTFTFSTSESDISSATTESSCTATVKEIRARYWRMKFTNCTNLDSSAADVDATSYTALAGVSFLPAEHCAVSDLAIGGLQGYDALDTLSFLRGAVLDGSLAANLSDPNVGNLSSSASSSAITLHIPLTAARNIASERVVTESAKASPCCVITAPVTAPEKILPPEFKEIAEEHLYMEWRVPESGGHPIIGYEVQSRIVDTVKSEWQVIVSSGGASGGSFKITYAGGSEETPCLSFDSTAAVVRSLVMSSLPSLNMSFTGDNYTGFSNDGFNVTRESPAREGDPAGSYRWNLYFDAQMGNVSNTVEVVKCTSMGSSNLLYAYTARHGATLGFSTLVANTGSPLGRFNATALSKGRTYQFRVAAMTTTLKGTMSQPTRPQLTITTEPARVDVLVVSEVYATFAKLNWTTPSDPGGAPIHGYHVEFRPTLPSDGAFTTVVANTASSATEYIVSSLQVSTGYTFRVSALNLVGAGAASPGASTTTLAPQVPLGPKKVSAAPVFADAGNGLRSNLSLNVTWEPPQFNGGSAVTGYPRRSAGDVSRNTNCGSPGI